MFKLRVTTIALLIPLTGCTGQPVFEDVPILKGVEQFFAGRAQKSRVSSSPFVHSSKPASPSSPQPGDTVPILDTSTGKEIMVTLVSVYRAASGRSCSYYHHLGTNADVSEPNGLSCQDNELRWTRIPVLLSTNPLTPE